VLVAVSTHAATVVWDFTGANNAMSNVNSQSSTYAATSNDFGSGITASVFSASSPTGDIDFHAGRLKAQAKVDTDTMTFSITVPSGVFLDLTSLSFSWGNSGNDTACLNNWSLSVNGADRTMSVTSGLMVGVNQTRSTTSNFSGSGFSGITDSTVTFTLTDAAAGNNNTFAGTPAGPSFYTWYDDFVLTGVIDIPEPSAALLGALGLLALLRRRR
jgi:PEP-CTERM motif